jgi:hypothetical protein
MHATKLDHPTREFIATLPAFSGLGLSHIHWVGSEAAVVAALRELKAASALTPKASPFSTWERRARDRT